MWKARFGVAFWIGLAALLGASMAAEAQRRDRDDDRDRRSAQQEQRAPVGGDWQWAGTVEHKPSLERHTIKIGPERGAFSRLGLQVDDWDVEIIDLVVTYGNGATETFPVRSVLKVGERTRAFDFKGEGRYIRDVTVIYRPTGPTRISLFVDPWRRSRPGARWEQLGCQRVGLLERTDVIRVGRTEGNFAALKLTADGGNVRLDKVRVVYANGTSELLSVRSVLPDGGETRAIDLTGRKRGIDRIELYYIPHLAVGGRATVCAFGS